VSPPRLNDVVGQARLKDIVTDVSVSPLTETGAGSILPARMSVGQVTETNQNGQRRTMKWKNYNEEDCMYFVTTTLRKYTPLFLDDKIVNIIFDSLSFLRKNKGLKVYAYVVMPEHIHLVVDLFRSEATQGFRREDTPKHQKMPVR
jgi:hypothetical protein